MSERQTAIELATLRAKLQDLVDDASFANGVRVIRASKVAALLDQDYESIVAEVSQVQEVGQTTP